MFPRALPWSSWPRYGMASHMADLVLTLEALLTGKPAFIAPGVLSAMAKTPVSGPVRIGWLGLEGDARRRSDRPWRP